VNDFTINELKEKAKELRKTALTMIHEARSGHPGGAFSAAELISVLYFKELRIDPQNPKWEDRDRFVLSKGHVCPILYSALIHRGYLPYETIHRLRKEGSPFQGHPDMKKCPGLDISSGSLGQGLSVAVGMALGGKRDKKDYRVFALVGDGECQEGQIWEAAETAAKYKLDNLVVFVDDNGLQCDGPCSEIMPNRDIAAKFREFGFNTFTIDGHKVEEIVAVLDMIRGRKDGIPTCVVMKTVKGKGVSYMENVAEWHGKAPNDAEFELAMAELEGGRQ